MGDDEIGSVQFVHHVALRVRRIGPRVVEGGNLNAVGAQKIEALGIYPSGPASMGRETPHELDFPARGSLSRPDSLQQPQAVSGTLNNLDGKDTCKGRDH
jgi:hypothetical protein